MSAVAGGASSKANGKVAAGKGGAGKAAGNSGGKKGANSSNKTASSTDPLLLQMLALALRPMRMAAIRANSPPSFNTA